MLHAGSSLLYADYYLHPKTLTQLAEERLQQNRRLVVLVEGQLQELLLLVLLLAVLVDLQRVFCNSTSLSQVAFGSSLPVTCVERRHQAGSTKLD
jgi:hypothetical protein